MQKGPGRSRGVTRPEEQGAGASGGRKEAVCSPGSLKAGCQGGGHCEEKEEERCDADTWRAQSPGLVSVSRCKRRGERCSKMLHDSQMLYRCTNESMNRNRRTE